MSLGRRIYNLARAELRSVLRPRRLPRQEERRIEEELAKAREQEAAPAAEGAREAARDADIRRYYANLELPFGATAAEVRAAYRRLMRAYHPDRHAGEEAQRVATELAQRLRTAHDALLLHLGAV